MQSPFSEDAGHIPHHPRWRRHTDLLHVSGIRTSIVRAPPSQSFGGQNFLTAENKNL
jgi:hypothetical protein